MHPSAARKAAIRLALIPLLLVSACSSSRTEISSIVMAHTTTRLDAVGSSPEISVHNESGFPLPIEIGWGASPRSKDTIEPGTTRWWNPQGPRSFWFINNSNRAIAITCRVENAAMTYNSPAK